LRITNQRVEVIEVPATAEYVDFIRCLPDVEHILPLAVLGWSFDTKIHSLSCRARESKAYVIRRLRFKPSRCPISQWANFEISTVEIDGHDNRRFHLGDEMSV